MAASVRDPIANDAERFCSNGANFVLANPTWPRQMSCVNWRLNPGRRSDARVLVSVYVCQPTRPGCLACSKL